jgi:sulfatase maturation enzyme AslB (radical SAM superfamily)
MSESVYAFLSVLNNLAVRMLIDSSTKRCKIFGESHIEAALDDYAGIGNKSRRCVKGKFISKVVAQALNNGGRAFGVSSEQLKHSLSDPYVKRGISNVLVGAATFGITKPQTVGAPFLVVWNYTNACNLRCKHCYQNSEKTAVGNLSTAQRKQVVDQLAQENVVAVAFSGGEPLMSSDFFEVAGYASKNGLYVSMASNGTLITPSVAHKLKDCGVGYVDVSLDGAKAETHETFRGVSGCFDKTLAGIRNLVNEGITACVAVMLPSII